MPRLSDLQHRFLDHSTPETTPLESEESFIPDHRDQLSPSEIVEHKLALLLPVARVPPVHEFPRSPCPPTAPDL